MQHSLRSFLRLCLRCPFCLADRLRLSGQKGNTHCVRSFACGYAVLFSERITYGSSGEQAMFPGFSRHGTHRSAFRVHLVLDVHQLCFRSRQMILYHINDQGKWRTRKVLILFNFAHRKLFRKLPMQSLGGGVAGTGLLVLAEMLAERPVAAALPAVRMDEAQ